MSALTPRPAPATSLPLSGYDKRLMLFCGRANPELGAQIADKLGLGLGGVTLKTFSNGEVYCRYEESIRGADVFIVQPTCGNPATGVNANDALMELLVMIDAAVGASAHRVIAVMPWYGYSRQDKKSAPREPISARLVARMLEAAGADRVLTMDLHAGQVQGFFHKPVDHMTAMFILTQYFRDQQLEDLVVVSPDAGRVKLAKKFAEKVGAELAILNKERPAQQVAEIAYVIGDVKDKTAVIVDDIIDTAGTLRAAGETVKDEGARRVYAAATHAVLSGNAFENLAASPFERIVVTDTIPLRPGAPDNITVLSRGRPADGLHPPHLHRRLGLRGVRRREPAVLSARASAIPAGPRGRGAAAGPRQRRALRDHRRGGPAARGEDPARAAARARGDARRADAAALGADARPHGRPLDLLLRQDFAAFEDALADLNERGFMLSRPDPGASRRARPR